jgi:hypothetical protein
MTKLTSRAVSSLNVYSGTSFDDVIPFFGGGGIEEEKEL